MALALVVSIVVSRGGEISCGSAESMDHLMRAWTRDFTAIHPETPARIVRRAKFSAEAFDALLRGEVQIAPFARELFPAELARFREKFGRDPLLVPVASGSRDTKGGTHAIAIFVSAKNPLARLSLRQLREILARDGRIRTWGELGLGGEWARQKLVVHGMLRRRETGNPPGIVNFLEQRLLAGRAWREDVVEHADVPDGPQALELIVRAVAADAAAIGCSGFAYAQPGTRTLALAETDAGPFFAGSAEEIARRDYPLARRLYLCVDPSDLPATRAFLLHALAPAGQQAVADTPEKFLPLRASDVVGAREQVGR